MNQNPLFSIIMTNYNAAQYVDESIESVIKQTYKNWEIIFIDDVSTDNIREVMEKYKDDKRIKTFYNEVNIGVSAAYAKAVNLASGEICGILDSDDTLETHKALEKMVNYHLQYPDSGMISSRRNFCNINMKPLWTSLVYEKGDNVNYLTDIQHNSEHFFTFKTDEYKKVGGFNPEYKNAPDQDLYYRFEEGSKVTFVDDVLFNYRIKQGGLTHNGYKNIYWHTKAINEACARRGINPELVIEKLIFQIVEPYEMKYDRVVNSKAYKLGTAILKPLYKIKSLFD